VRAKVEQPAPRTQHANCSRLSINFAHHLPPKEHVHLMHVYSPHERSLLQSLWKKFQCVSLRSYPLESMRVSAYGETWLGAKDAACNAVVARICHGSRSRHFGTPISVQNGRIA